MSSQELAEVVSPEIINSIVLTGDISKLTTQQQTTYYAGLCKTLGLNPLTQPFVITTYQGKKILYAAKSCTQQLCDVRKINTEVVKRETLETVYVVSVRATMPDGRYTDEDGAVGIAGVKGQDLANAMMKAVTKAKRRAVLALCGLGIPDESEVEDIQQHPASKANTDKKQSRIEKIVNSEISEAEIVDQVSEPEQDPASTPEPVKTKKKADPSPAPEPKEIKTIIGLIEEKPEAGKMVEKDGKPQLKYVFKIDGKNYGTFDTSLVKGIMECADKRIMVKFGYTERLSPKGNVLNDIVNFSQATINEVPI